MTWAAWVIVAIELLGLATTLHEEFRSEQADEQQTPSGALLVFTLGWVVLLHHAGMVLNWAGCLILVYVAIGCVYGMARITFEGLRIKTPLAWKLVSIALSFYLYYEAGIFGGDIQGLRF